MVLPDDTIEDFHEGFARLRDDFDVPGEHPPDVLEAADAAAARSFDVVQPAPTAPSRWQHVDRTDREFLTLERFLSPTEETRADPNSAVDGRGVG